MQKQYQKGSALVWVVVLVFVLAGAGGYMLWKNQSTKSAGVGSPEQSTPVSQSGSRIKNLLNCDSLMADIVTTADVKNIMKFSDKTAVSVTESHSGPYPTCVLRWSDPQKKYNADIASDLPGPSGEVVVTPIDAAAESIFISYCSGKESLNLGTFSCFSQKDKSALQIYGGSIWFGKEGYAVAVQGTGCSSTQLLDLAKLIVGRIK